MTVENFEVINNHEASRFEVALGKDTFAVIKYARSGDNYIFIRTLVPDEYEGQGIASKMTKAALEMVKAEGVKLIARCPYTRTYLQRHPEYQSLVIPDSGE